MVIEWESVFKPDDKVVEPPVSPARSLSTTKSHVESQVVAIRSPDSVGESKDRDVIVLDDDMEEDESSVVEEKAFETLMSVDHEESKGTIKSDALNSVMETASNLT